MNMVCIHNTYAINNRYVSKYFEYYIRIGVKVYLRCYLV